MAQHHDQGRTKLQDGVRHTAHDAGFSGIDEVAGNADNEQIADALIEQNLGRNSGIRATNDYGFGSLVRSPRGKVLRSAARIDGFSLKKSLIPI
jgi:hypothetical protein